MAELKKLFKAVRQGLEVLQKEVATIRLDEEWRPLLQKASVFFQQLEQQIPTDDERDEQLAKLMDEFLHDVKESPEDESATKVDA